MRRSIHEWTMRMNQLKPFEYNFQKIGKNDVFLKNNTSRQVFKDSLSKILHGLSLNTLSQKFKDQKQSSKGVC